jgi:hypothetical protein
VSSAGAGTAAPLALRKAPEISLDSAQNFGHHESASRLDRKNLELPYGN